MCELFFFYILNVSQFYYGFDCVLDVARNNIFSLKWRYYGLKGGIWNIGEQSYFIYYSIISYERIKVYRVETMYMERFNNGVSGKYNHSKYCGVYCNLYDTFVGLIQR